MVMNAGTNLNKAIILKKKLMNHNPMTITAKIIDYNLGPSSLLTKLIEKDKTIIKLTNAKQPIMKAPFFLKCSTIKFISKTFLFYFNADISLLILAFFIRGSKLSIIN